MAVADLGYQSKFGIGPSAGGVATTAIDFLRESLSLEETLVDLGGLRGTVARQASRVRTVRQAVQGDVTMQPSAAELAALLPYLLGGTPAGTSYPLAETLPLLVAQMTKGLKLFTWPGMTFGRGVFRCTSGGPLELTGTFFGTTEAVAASSGFPVLTLDNSTGPFVASDSGGGVAVNSVNVDYFDFTLTIDNAVQQRFVNAITPTLTYRTDRLITWELVVPYGDAEALYGLSSGGVTATISFLNGGTSVSFTSPKVAFARVGPPVEGRDEIRMTLRGDARYSAAAGDEIAIVVDSTP